MSPVPACLVTGLTGADKRRFLVALVGMRPANTTWALLDNDGGGSARDLTDSGIATAVVNGCACCSGQVMLQTGIVQLLRRERPQLLIIAVDGAAEPEALDRVLRQPGITGSVTPALQLCIAPAQWFDVLPGHARARLQRQMQAADGVIAGGGNTAAKLQAAGARQLLQAEEAIRRVSAVASGVSASASRIAS
ncbi:MAG: GTP-binding protein [Burkholderiales bacterium]|jgi:G3E family GTPase|nr:GTP-binding protein [Burkholderiales bacterium]MDP2399645.1 GTP-binding protein [Burkholderiales bacterium]